MTLRSDDHENNAEGMLLNDFIRKRIDIVPFLAPLPKVLNDILPNVNCAIHFSILKCILLSGCPPESFHKYKVRKSKTEEFPTLISL